MKDIGLKVAGLLGGINKEGVYTGSLSNIPALLQENVGSEIKGAGRYGSKGVPGYIHIAKSFDSLLKKNQSHIVKEGKSLNQMVKENKFTSKFDNEEFLSFWVRNHNLLYQALSQTDYQNSRTGALKHFLLPYYEDQFKSEPFYNKFKDLLNVKKSETQPVSSPKAAAELTSVDKKGKTQEVKDLTWLEKLSSISAYKNILSNLMYSVNPLITGENTSGPAVVSNYAEYSPDSHYNDISSLNIDRTTKGLTKQKAQELYNNLCNFKDEVKDQKSHHEIKVVLNAKKSAIELCKAGLINIMESPQYNEGGKYLASSATKYRTGNEGSHGESASSSLIS